MGPLVIAVVALLGTLAESGTPQSADGYAVQVDHWQAITARMVALVDEVVSSEALWGVVSSPAGRQEWWSRLTTLADGAPRPTPPDEPVYSETIAPLRAGLYSLAMSMRTGRRDEARAALDTLRQFVPPN